MVIMIMQPDQDQRRSSQRLPVNPRRNKVAPEQRKRVATACNGCNVRRIKCSGERPCRQCAASSRECVYPVTVEKVSIARSELDDLRRRLDATERALGESVPDPSRRQELLQHHQHHHHHHPASSPASSTSPGSIATPHPTPSSWPGHGHYPSSLAGSIKAEPIDDEKIVIEGRMLRDATGSAARFFGETSEAAFLDHLKEFMATLTQGPSPEHQLARDGSAFLASLGRHASSDSRFPLHDDLDVNPLWLPASDTLASMLTQLRYLIQDGNGEWPSGGIFWWGDLTSLPVRPAAADDDDDDDDSDPDLAPYRPLAFHQACLAILCETTASKPPANASQPHPSEASYTRAMQLLGRNPLDVSRCNSNSSSGGNGAMHDAATLALLGLYMLETDRCETACAYVSAAVRVAVMHGAHRGWMDEASKRVFWSIYVLDRWLSCAMGRAPGIADETIRLSLPSDAPSLPPSAGLTAHVELARISGYIVNDASNSSSSLGITPAQNHQKTLWMLDHWLSSLPQSLRLSADGLTNDLGSALLHMCHNHLTLVAMRPMFFDALKKLLLLADGLTTAQHTSLEAQSHAAQLLSSVSAAQRTVRLARHMASLQHNNNNNQRRQRQRRPVFQRMALHYIFSAALCLALFDAVAEQTTTPTEDVPSGNADLEFATELLETEAQTAGSPYAASCAETLRNLGELLSDLRSASSLSSSSLSASLSASLDPSLLAGSQLSPPVVGAADGQVPMQMQGGGMGAPEMYDELMAWMENDWTMFDGGNMYMG